MSRAINARDAQSLRKLLEIIAENLRVAPARARELAASHGDSVKTDVFVSGYLEAAGKEAAGAIQVAIDNFIGGRRLAS